jgi:hypothetical protein
LPGGGGTSFHESILGEEISCFLRMRVPACADRTVSPTKEELAMQVNATSPVSLNFNRHGGSVITARLDFWRSTPQGWQLAGSNLFQAVTLPQEVQVATLAPGSYTTVFTCRVEESVNGVYDFAMTAGGVDIGHDAGNVDTTSNAHDSKVYKNQFVLNV